MNEVTQNVLRSIVTVALFGLFLALVCWAWSPRRRKEFSDAANLVFDDTDKSEARAQDPH